jgi:hypothetical protein
MLIEKQVGRKSRSENISRHLRYTIKNDEGNEGHKHDKASNRGFDVIWVESVRAKSERASVRGDWMEPENQLSPDQVHKAQALAC